MKASWWFLVNFGLVGITVCFAFILSSSNIYANEPAASASANAAVIVPDACTLSGTGMTSHNAEIANGTSNSNIGETTMKAYCNDNEGFAIYAIGYTDNTDGKNVLTNSTLGSTHDIATGIDTSGNSQWAMKVTTVSSPTPTYPITIQNSFDSFHTVPDDYALVAKRTAGTDVGTNAEGSTLKTTYQAYISNTQLAATYTGQVKYVLVHPNDIGAPAHDDEIVVVYNGNGSTFAGGATRNRVVYGHACPLMYIATTPEVIETSNLTNGVKNSAYTNDDYVFSTKTYPGAEKVRVVVDYGITADTAGLGLAEGIWDGDWDTLPDTYYEIYSESENLSGTETYTFDGDTITVELGTGDFPITDYDYGFYVKIYPIYDTEETGTEEISVCQSDYSSVSGSYATTTPWQGFWYLNNGQEMILFEDENEILEYLEENSSRLLGTVVNIYASDVSYGKLDTGENVHNKLWNLAGYNGDINENGAYNDTIMSIKMANSLPVGFVPSDANTISLSTFGHPVYTWFDDSDGTIYIYTTADKIRLNADSSEMFARNINLVDLSGLVDLDTSGVVSMAAMFSNTSIVDISDLANWDVSNVINMRFMFAFTPSSLERSLPESWDLNPDVDLTDLFFRGLE